MTLQRLAVSANWVATAWSANNCNSCPSSRLSRPCPWTCKTAVRRLPSTLIITPFLFVVLAVGVEIAAGSIGRPSSHVWVGWMWIRMTVSVVGFVIGCVALAANRVVFTTMFTGRHMRSGRSGVAAAPAEQR